MTYSRNAHRKINVGGANVGHGRVPEALTDTVLMVITWGLYEVIDNPLNIMFVIIL